MNPVCLPARCGRFISDSLVTVADAHKLLNIAKKGLAKVIWFDYTFIHIMTTYYMKIDLMP